MKNNFTEKEIELLETFGNPSILNLGEMVRYNNRAKIKQENVATHSWIASSDVLKICDRFNIEESVKREALEMIVVHDIAELATNDIPYDFKRDNPIIKALLEEAELNFLEREYPEFAKSYRKLIQEEKTGSLLSIIVKLADAMSVLKYSNNEINLGNKTQDMKQINRDTKVRVLKSIQLLEEKLKEEK